MFTKCLSLFHRGALVQAPRRRYNGRDQAHEPMLRVLLASGNDLCWSPGEERCRALRSTISSPAGATGRFDWPRLVDYRPEAGFAQNPGRASG